jgi:acetylornithine deacetylase/succinyl-diaminopimelate desuccinylase-like protein
MATAPETLRDGWLDELGEFLAIPSVSADPAYASDVRRAADWVGDRVRALGGDAEAQEDGRLLVPDRPALRQCSCTGTTTSSPRIPSSSG